MTEQLCPSGIYKITCAPTGKMYIGSASNIKGRRGVHKHLLRKGEHHSIHLQRAYDKYGERCFVFDVIERVNDVGRLIEREQHYIDEIRPFGGDGFNISTVAGSTRGVKRTPEQVESMAARFRGKSLTREHRQKIRVAMTGLKKTEETKQKIREARIKNNGQRGRPMTDRQKKALHKSGKDHPWFKRKHSKESIEKISMTKSTPVIQVLPGGVEKMWLSAKSAAAAVGLRSPDCIYRAIKDSNRKAAGFRWRRVQDRAVVS